ncbi:endolytic transglycosylase MltG [Bifidobacterium callitrichidarum]|uniref:Endolytic murein transglycosylase n=1 Tax=Bifidobacterium callitrichidarum TaxID=2052941 RepID=A0A2U2NBE5_9BIFI|nr:endolytic transglycosylase MltG [Bifidobacterium callitrichidarum]PWG66408.1 endolytic transglycosylase MltG [Bifidobacterium callitrichidarum]
MSDDFHDFFDENTHWVEQGAAAPAGNASEPPKPPKSRKEMRKRRAQRRRKRVSGIIAALVVIAVIAGAGYFGVTKLMAWRDSRSQNTAVAADYPGPGYGEVDFTVDDGQGAAEIAQNLVEADVIKSAAAFTSLVSANSTTLYPGTFTLKKHMSASSVVAILSDSKQAAGFLEVRPGERSADVIEAAASLTGIDQSDFDAIVKNKGKGILPSEANGSFEGWFEPGTYNVKSMKTASAVLKAMVDKRIAKLDDLGVPTGKDRERVMIIASIAEAEVNKSDYYAKVTRVIENRLEQGMNLGMDSTVAYGNNVKPAQVTTAMTQDESNPYNTYKIAGLPPTPISNPGDTAIKAAMNPEEGDWLYFCTVNLDTGETKFATTAEEHDKNVAELRQWQADNQ